VLFPNTINTITRSLPVRTIQEQSKNLKGNKKNSISEVFNAISVKKLTILFQSFKKPSLKNKEGTLITFSETKNKKKVKRTYP
jgi:hypothetical protein